MPTNRLSTLYKASALSLAIALASCSFSPTKNSFDELVASKRFDSAITAYDSMSPELQASIDIDAVKKQREAYTDKRVAELRQLTKSNKFIKAQDIAKELAASVPSSAEAKQAIADLRSAEKRFLDQYQHEYDQQLAYFYINEKPLLDNLLKVPTNNKTNQAIAEARKIQRQRLAETLGEYGLNALAKGHRKTAKTNLTLANQLNKDKRWQDGLNTIAAYHKKQRTEKQAQEKQAQQEAWQAKADQFEASFNQRQWLKAQKQLQEIALMAEQPDQKAWLSKQSTRLQLRVDQKVQNAYQQGLNLYSQGDVEKAIATWEEVLPLAPNNPELLESLERARSFQRTYQQLKPAENVEL